MCRALFERVTAFSFCLLTVVVLTATSCPMDTDMDGVPDDADICPGMDDGADANQDGVPDCAVTAAKVISTEPPDSVNPGAVAAFSFQLQDGTGHVWDITGRGETFNGGNPTVGTSNAFDGFVNLYIDNTVFPVQVAGDLEDGREVVLGPASMGGLDVTRKIFVSDTEGFARWLDILENNTVGALAVDVRTKHNMGSDETNDLVITSSNGNSTLESGDTWWVNCQQFGADPCVASFFCGATPSKTSDDIDYQYGTVTVPPGDRVIIVTYVAMRSADLATATDLLAAFNAEVGALTDLMEALESFPCVDESLLKGMSSAELNDVYTCGGTVCVSGVAGSVAAGAVVTVTDLNTTDSRVVTAASNGAWTASVIGASGDGIAFAATDGTSGNVTVP